MKLAKLSFEDLLREFFNACDEKTLPIDKIKVVVSLLLLVPNPCPSR